MLAVLKGRGPFIGVRLQEKYIFPERPRRDKTNCI